MYKLPRNFTGLNVNPIEVNEFKAICYSLQGLGLIKVLSISEYDYPKNYYIATVRDGMEEFLIFFNCFVGAIGLGTSCDKKFLFITRPGIEAAICSINEQYHVVSCNTLNSEARKESLICLAIIEAKNVSRWLLTFLLYRPFDACRFAPFFYNKPLQPTRVRVRR